MGFRNGMFEEDLVVLGGDEEKIIGLGN